MRIGTIRAEEARAGNCEEGYHPIHNEDGSIRGRLEVFWDDADVSQWGGDPRNYDSDGEPVQPGWYWVEVDQRGEWLGDPSGPFGHSLDALTDGDEFHPEYRDD